MEELGGGGLYSYAKYVNKTGLFTYFRREHGARFTEFPFNHRKGFFQISLSDL